MVSLNFGPQVNEFEDLKIHEFQFMCVTTTVVSAYALSPVWI